jgi:hypothetical protein
LQDDIFRSPLLVPDLLLQLGDELLLLREERIPEQVINPIEVEATNLLGASHHLIKLSETLGTLEDIIIQYFLIHIFERILLHMHNPGVDRPTRCRRRW